MKIQAGFLKAQTFDQPKSSTVRPVSDKVRAAIFDVVGVPEGGVMLDAYAGSGAVGFEALSRGVSMVEAIEGNRSVARIIESNVKKLKLDWGYLLHVLKVETWLVLPGNQPDMARTQERYNLIVADPPYARLESDVLDRLAAFLIPGGVLVVSHSSKLESPVLESISLTKAKVYGDTALSFYQRDE